MPDLVIAALILGLLLCAGMAYLGYFLGLGLAALASAIVAHAEAIYQAQTFGKHPLTPETPAKASNDRYWGPG